MCDTKSAAAPGEVPETQFGTACNAGSSNVNYVLVPSQQPTNVVVGPISIQEPASDYLGISIFAMLCCCFPCNLFAIISSIITREANRYGDARRKYYNNIYFINSRHRAVK